MTEHRQSPRPDLPASPVGPGAGGAGERGGRQSGLSQAVRGEMPPTAAPLDRVHRPSVHDLAIIAMVAAGIWAALSIEVLSAAGRLRAGWLAMWWLATIPGAAALGWRVWSGGDVGAMLRWRRIGILDGAALAWTGLVAGLTLITAAAAAPLTWDSLTYHLTRVAHWAQNESIAFYPTHIIRQLHPPPWAEYAMLQLYLLSGGDGLANLVQWGAFAGCLVGSSGVARALGGGGRAQVLAAFVCATIPMGILQASSTQNDLVVALWLVCLAYASLRARAARSALWCAVAGAALGLACLTKGTAYIFAGPIAAIGFWPGAGVHRRVAVRGAIAALACAVALNAPHGARNLGTFGWPLGPGGEGGDYTYRNREISLRVLASNMSRNVALHAGTPLSSINRAIESGVERLHGWIGLAPDDPRTTWPGTRLAVTRPTRDEDRAGNGPHALLIAGATVAAAVARRRGHAGGLAGYAAVIWAGFLLFNLLLKWQPWHSRLQLPLFVLAAPLAGCVLARARPRVTGAIMLVLGVASAPYAIANDSRPLLGASSVVARARGEQRARFTSGSSYPAAVRAIPAGCDTLGLVLGSNDPEYVVWTLLREAGRRPRIGHVLVANASGQVPVPSGGRPACAVIADTPFVGEVAHIGELRFRRIWADGPLSVLTPMPGREEAPRERPIGPQ